MIISKNVYLLNYTKKEKNSEHVRKEVEEHLTEDSRIVAMSTCKYPDSVYRVVVFAELVNPHQTKTNDN